MQGFANIFMPIVILLICTFIWIVFEDLLKIIFNKFKEWCNIKDLFVGILANIVFGVLQT